MADLIPPADDDGFVEGFLNEVAGLGSAEPAQVVHECRELLAPEKSDKMDSVVLQVRKSMSSKTARV